MFFQVISLFGAAALLFAYIAAQMGRMRHDSAVYNALNAAGSALLAWVAVHDQRWGFILLEGIWAVVSIPPLFRAWRARATA